MTTFKHTCFWRMMLLALLLAVTVCVHARKKPRRVQTQPVVTVRLSDNDARRFSYFYLEAVRQQEKGNYAAAFDLLRHCLEINPSSAETYFLLSSYYVELGEDSTVLSCMERAAALSPTNNNYQERLGQTYIKIGDYAKATKVYEQLAAANAGSPDVLTVLLQLYQQDKNYQGMIDVLHRLEMIDGPSEDITLSRMRVYSKQGKKKEEYKELCNLARQHPNDYNYRVMIGNWLLQNGKEKEALNEYHAVLKKEPDHMMAQMSLLDYYKTQGMDSLVKAQTESLLMSDKTENESKIILLRQVISENEKSRGDSTEVLNLFARLLEKPQKNADIAELCAAYMSLKQMPEDTVNVAFERVLDIAPDNAGIRLELLQSVWKTKDYDRIIQLSKTGVEYNPDNMGFYYFLGLAHSMKDEKDESLDAFRRGVSQINSDSNPALVSDFYEIMGDLLHEKGFMQEAFAAYDSCLQWKPDNIPCLNNYAYYLSLQGKDLPKAEQMSYRTVKAEPNSSTYLDTYAWILFMQGRYEEARIYIDQAVKNDTTHSMVITEHAGDIYYMNNEPEKGLEYWQKALEMADEDDDSALLQRKIKLKKYIEK